MRVSPILIALAVVVVAAVPALAETAPVTALTITNPDNPDVIHFGPILNAFLQAIVPIIGTIAGALGIWLLAVIKQKTGLNIDWINNQVIQQAAQNAAGKFLAQFDSLKNVDVNVGNPILASIANEGLLAIPDAAAHFGLTPTAFAQMVVAKVGLVAPMEGTASTTEPAPTAPANAAPMPSHA